MSYRILGLDPGTATTGFACIDTHHHTIEVIDIGYISTQKHLTLAERLHELANDIENIINTVVPDAVSIEKIFFAKNVKTGISVAHARGVLLYCSQKSSIEVFEYSPNEIKTVITGDGHADKLQIQKMVKLWCGLATLPKTDDAADALATALCHAIKKETAIPTKL